MQVSYCFERQRRDRDFTSIIRNRVFLHNFKMVKSSEKEKALTELVSLCRTPIDWKYRTLYNVQTSKIFDAMLEEIVMDTVLASHQEMAKSRTICHICHTRYAYTCSIYVDADSLVSTLHE